MTIHPNTPVIVGVGQCLSQWRGGAVHDAPSPQGLRAEAARLALADSGQGAGLAASIDRVVAVRTMPDSVPGMPQPFGRCASPAATLASDLGITARDAIHSVVGGDQPQALVNESADAIFAGEARTILLAGAEAMAAMKAALKAGIALDWSHSADAGDDDRGLGPMLLSPYAIANGLGAPTQTYPAFEHALRARWRHSPAEHRAAMSELWAGFSAVAARNPYAQFPVARDAAFLSKPSDENYPVADPYLKWDVAQDAVNQGAAVILTSVAEADRLGIAADRRVFLHGHAAAKDRCPSERDDLSRSLPMAATLRLALDSAGVGPAGLAAMDLYSCFPVAVFLAAEALGLDWREQGGEALTVTGGLPFFGGAGNNYSMHAIASMAVRRRAAPGSFGLVLANGGFLSKEAAGVYSTTPRADWAPMSSASIQAEIDAAPMPRLLSETMTGTIETATVTYAKGEPSRGYAFVRRSDGARAVARTAKGEAGRLAALMAESDPIGRSIAVRHEDGVNILELAR
jgi:acetyl-CoA C-acetyltransferase